MKAAAGRFRPAYCPVCRTQMLRLPDGGRVPNYYGRLVFPGKSPGWCPNHNGRRVPLVVVA